VAEGGELAHYSLGLAFRQRALFDEALREFRLATERGEDSFLVQQAQAELLLLRGAAWRRCELYEELIEVESGSPKLWNELGVCAAPGGRAGRGGAGVPAVAGDRRHVRSGVEQPGSGAAPSRRESGRGGSVSAALQEPRTCRTSGATSRSCCTAVGPHGGESGGVRAERWRRIRIRRRRRPVCGVLLLDLGRAEEARSVLLRAVEVDPHLAEARYHLAFALSALGDYQGALRETKTRSS
jgi:cellulose synthase operon protein C